MKPHTWFAGHRNNKLELEWKFPLCWLDFRVLEVAKQDARGKLSLTVLLISGPCMQQYQPASQDESSGIVM